MQPTNLKNYDPKIDKVRAFACMLVATVHFGVPQWTFNIKEVGIIIDTAILGFNTYRMDRCANFFIYFRLFTCAQ